MADSGNDKTVRLEVTDLAFDGKAVAHLDGKVVFLNGGLPGETVEARIFQSKPRFSRGRVVRIIEKAPERVEPRCPHFEYCGGCTWQDLDYDQQLRFKRKQVVDCIERLAKLPHTEISEILPAPDQFFYRNKMEFSFHTGGPESDDFTLGLHRRGRFDDIFDLHDCRLQSELSNRLVTWMRDYVRRTGLPVYDVKQHTGFMRFLMIRQTAHTGQTMVNLVTNYGDFPDTESLTAEIAEAFPEVTTVVHNQNGQKSNIATGEIEKVLSGPGYIEEELGGCRFRIRANSFFQTNSLQAENLYNAAFEMLAPEPSDRILDLYCGTGAIGLLLAVRAEHVIGVELVADAIVSARENAALNGRDNIDFYEGNVKDFLKAETAAAAEHDVIVIDPPRAGLHPKALKEVIALKPRKLLYISCNPATFARDAERIVGAGYALPSVRPVDMFPHTMHIELIGCFEPT